VSEMARKEVSGRLRADTAAAWIPGAVLILTALLLLANRLVSAARHDLLAVDFRQTYLPAAEAILHGHSPYPEYGYPPLVAFLSLPFAVAPGPDVFVTVVMLACIPLSLWLFGVRDWRCYAAACLWASVFNAVQTANVTLPILVGAAACWRWRDRPALAGVTGGLTFATKIISWPLALWLAATRRWTAAIGFVLVGAAVTLGLWATLGFSGLDGYIDSLGRLADQEAPNGYTLQALGTDLGLPDAAASALGSMLALVSLAGVVVFGRRGDDPRSFACAMVAVIVASPLIWLHSFALLLAPLAVLRPKLTWVWLLPAVLWFVSPGTGNGATWQTSVTLAVAAIIVLEALRPTAPTKPEWRAPVSGTAEAT
jgi:hypothetical protein